MTRWKRGALIAVCVLVVTYPACWFGLQHTEAYQLAQSFIRTDAEVASLLGPVREVTLPLFASYSFEVSGGTGSAVFEMAVDAEHSQARAFVDLRKRGVWEVTDARLVTPGGTSTRLEVPR